MVAMNLPSVIVACCALVFTVGSFYWLQARKGRLKLYPVTTFMGAANNRTFVLRVPIIIYNSGARPRVVCGIRLRWQGDKKFLFECHTFRKTIDAQPGDHEDYAHPYVIPGRNVVTKFANFRGEDFACHLSDKSSIFDVEVMLDDQPEWKPLGPVRIHTEIMNDTGYVTYSNIPGVWPDGILEEAEEHRKGLNRMRERVSTATSGGEVRN